MKKTHLLLLTLPCVLSALSLKAVPSSSLQDNVTTDQISPRIAVIVEDPTENVPSSPVTADAFFFCHDDFTVEFPQDFDAKNKNGMELITCYNNGNTLKAMVFPVGLEEIALVGLSEAENIIPDITKGKNVNFYGRIGKAYPATEDVSLMETGDGIMYVVNNGEKTYAFFQTSVGQEDFWANHFGWNKPVEEQKTPSELLKGFQNFINDQILSNSDGKVDFVEEDKSIVINNFSDNKELTQQMASEMLFSLLNNFSVFKEFANMEYDYTIALYTTDGKLKDKFTFTYPQYSKWTDYEQLMEFLDENQPEGTMERPHRAIGG